MKPDGTATADDDADADQSSMEHHATPAKIMSSPSPMMRQLQEDPMLAHVMQDQTPGKWFVALTGLFPGAKLLTL